MAGASLPKPPASFRRRLLLLLLLFSAAAAAAAAAQPLQLNDDVIGLILFKSELVDSLDQLVTWAENDTEPCAWKGVTCDALNRRVVAVDLRSLSLSGHLGGGGLAKLPFLRRLSLSDNRFSGDISAAAAALSSLPRLLLLDLSHNLLSGDASPLSASPSLRYLDLSHNRFSGTIPPPLFCSSSSSLRRLSLAGNLLTGPIPYTVGQCWRLKALNLSGNALSATLPPTISAISRLSQLDLSNNLLSGSSLPLFPPNLLDLRLNGNQLSADIGAAASAIFGAANSIQYLDLSSNRLTGSVPADLLSLASLVSLNLRQNQLAGTLPPNLFCGGGSLESVDVSDNSIGGTVPAGCGGVAAAAPPPPTIGYMNLSYNRLTSAAGVNPGAAMVVLDLSHNQLSGEIGELELSDARRLAALRLNGNNLTGLIPPSLLNCSSLMEINLAQNRLSGGIPPELGNLTELISLDLSYNNFSGGLPPQLDWLQKLSAFNVSYNWLQGMIPDGAVLAKFDGSAYKGNSGLCGAQLGVACSGSTSGVTMPKPAVLGPNAYGWVSAATGMSMRKLLSASSIIAIAAAAAIVAGVAVILFLNRYAKTLTAAAAAATPASEGTESLSTSTETTSVSSSDGKLVMLAGGGKRRWISSSLRGMFGKNGELGRGAVGSAYKAVLTDGRTVVVKKSSPMTRTRLESQVNSLVKITHPNLLPLLGYYWSPNLQFLVYEFAPKGNLHNLLHQSSSVRAPLDDDWTTRLLIALGIAHGLAHLHHSFNPPIIHYSLKSNNILLDDRYNPKITDHSLATRLLGKQPLSSSSAALGYMVPEFASRSSNISDKYDVYGYGVILLELVTGKRPVEYRDDDDVIILCDYVRALVEGGRAMTCVDPRMTYFPEVQVLSVIKLGLMCTSQVPSNRPSMREVVQILELIQTSGDGQ